MANENTNQTKSTQVKPNPSRYNGKVASMNNENANQEQNQTSNRGSNGKNINAQSGSDGNVEIDTAGLDRTEVDLDRSGVDNSEGGETHELSPDTNESENSDQGLQAGSGADYGSGAVRGTSGQADATGTPTGGRQLNRNQDDSKLQ